MKLTRREAQLFIDQASTSHPHPHALARILAHDWTFDPRGHRITLTLRRFHEQQQILYGTWLQFREELVDPHDSSLSVLRCDLCATNIPSPPFFTAANGSGIRFEICCPCALAMGGCVSPSSRVKRCLPSGVRFSKGFPRTLASFWEALRRFFG